MENQSKEATLIIFSWYSKCSACGEDADPRDKAHVKRLGYHAANLPEEHPERKGCGAKFTAVTSGMFGLGIEQAAKRMRPDLPYVEDKIFTL